MRWRLGRGTSVTAPVMRVFDAGDVFGRTIECASANRRQAEAEFRELVETLNPGQRAVLRDGDRTLAAHDMNGVQLDERVA
jgi:hypothetical protein